MCKEITAHLEAITGDWCEPHAFACAAVDVAGVAVWRANKYKSSPERNVLQCESVERSSIQFSTLMPHNSVDIARTRLALVQKALAKMCDKMYIHLFASGLSHIGIVKRHKKTRSIIVKINNCWQC